MEMILVEDVTGLGQKGSVVNVKPGYARNYLLPRKLAISATKNASNLYQELQRQRGVQEDKRLIVAREAAAKVNGPDPTVDLTWVKPSIAASCSRITNGARTGEARVSSTGPNGLLSAISMVRSSIAAMLLARAASAWPAVTRCAQRRIDAATSCARTGDPSWNCSPGRSTKRQVMPSSLRV